MRSASCLRNCPTTVPDCPAGLRLGTIADDDDDGVTPAPPPTLLDMKRRDPSAGVVGVMLFNPWL